MGSYCPHSEFVGTRRPHSIHQSNHFRRNHYVENDDRSQPLRGIPPLTTDVARQGPDDQTWAAFKLHFTHADEDRKLTLTAQTLITTARRHAQYAMR